MHLLGRFPVEVNMIGIPKGVLHRSDQRSNFADKSPPPPIPPRTRKGNSTVAVVDLQHRDDFKYATP